MGVKGGAMKAQKGTRNTLLETGGKGVLLDMAESLAEFRPTVMWKTELVNDGFRHLAEISKQSVEGVT